METPDDNEFVNASLQARFGSEVSPCLPNLPNGFADRQNESVMSNTSKDTFLNTSTSNFSDNFKSYREQMYSVHAPINPNNNKTDRLSDNCCNNCITF